jgi:hypothetical protein
VRVFGPPSIHGNRRVTLVDPRPEARPLRGQGLVGDLDRRLPGDQIAVEAEQAVAAASVDHDLHRRLPKGDEFAAGDPAAEDLGALADADQSEQPLARRFPRLVVELRVQRFGPAHERARRTPGLPVDGKVDALSPTPVEQLGQRVLEQREGTGAVGNVGNDLGHHAGLETNVHATGRAGDRPGDLLGGHG